VEFSPPAPLPRLQSLADGSKFASTSRLPAQQTSTDQPDEAVIELLKSAGCNPDKMPQEELDFAHYFIRKYIRLNKKF
jgi:hypothetical protein